MAIQNVGLKAYTDAMQTARAFAKRQQQSMMKPDMGQGQDQYDSFAKVIGDSLSKVNNLETQKKSMIESFAAGETQNVHELMITLQKAGLAMSMTSAVRGKVMEAYKEIMRTSF